MGKQASNTTLQDIVHDLDPIKRLPYEIWLECLLFAIDGFAEGPLPYCNISLRWNQAILDAPDAWTTIILDNGEDLEARVHTFLYLSANRPLHLHVLGLRFLVEPYDILRTVLSHSASRLKSIRLPPHPPDQFDTWTPQIGSIFDIFEEFGPYNNVTLLHLGNDFARIRMPATLELWKGLVHACPNVLWIRGEPLPNSYDELIGSQISGASFTVGEHSVRLPLYDRTTFKSLSITYRDFWNNNPPKSLFYPKANLLEELYISASSWPVLHGLLDPPYQQLQKLVVGISSNMIPLLLINIPSFPHLRFFQIDLIYEATSPAKPLGVLRGITPWNIWSVHDFKIRIGAIALPEDPEIVELIERGAPFHHLVSFSLDISSSLLRLHRDDISRILSVVKGVKELSMRLGNWPKQENRSEATEMPKLWHLRADANGVMEYLKAPSLTHYIYNGNSRPGLEEGGERRTPDGDELWYMLVNSSSLPDPKGLNLSRNDQWPNLKHVVWLYSTQFDAGRTIQFGAISTVEFNSSYRYCDVAMAPITKFCVLLIRIPGACPHLTTIKSSAYPSWGPLFDALRSRNAQGLTRLEQLWLPSVPIPLILSGLARLMKGDISVTMQKMDEAILRRFHDVELVACVQCLATGHIHCAPSTKTVPISSTRDESKDSCPSQKHITDNYINYKASGPCLHWKKWEARLKASSKAWKRKKGEPRRRSTCSRHQLTRLVPITRYTLYGMEEMITFQTREDPGDVDALDSDHLGQETRAELASVSR